MSESQKQTIAQYQGYLDATALAACLNNAVQLGIFSALKSGQKTLDELAKSCDCQPEALGDLLRLLEAAGAVEVYGEYIALSQAIALMAPADSDFGLAVWRQLPDYLKTTDSAREGTIGLDTYRQRITTRQWSHTAAAVQAADALGIGRRAKNLKVLELGSGAGVWSAAMMYRDEGMQLTIVDHGHMLTQVRATMDSISLLDRVTLIDEDYRLWSPPLGEFDMVILPEIVQLDQDPAAVVLLGRAADALRDGGQVVVLETLREPDGPTLPLATQALELAVATGGRQRSAAELQRLLLGAGFGDGQWGWLTASPHGIGLIVAEKI